MAGPDLFFRRSMVLARRNLSSGAIAGIVVATVFGIVVCLVLCVFPLLLRLVSRRRKRASFQCNGDPASDIETGETGQWLFAAARSSNLVTPSVLEGVRNDKDLSLESVVRSSSADGRCAVSTTSSTGPADVERYASSLPLAVNSPPSPSALAVELNFPVLPIVDGHSEPDNLPVVDGSSERDNAAAATRSDSSSAIYITSHGQNALYYDSLISSEALGMDPELQNQTDKTSWLRTPSVVLRSALLAMRSNGSGDSAATTSSEPSSYFRFDRHSPLSRSFDRGYPARNWNENSAPSTSATSPQDSSPVDLRIPSPSYQRSRSRSSVSAIAIAMSSAAATPAMPSVPAVAMAHASIEAQSRRLPFASPESPHQFQPQSLPCPGTVNPMHIMPPSSDSEYIWQTQRLFSEAQSPKTLVDESSPASPTATTDISTAAAPADWRPDPDHPSLVPSTCTISEPLEEAFAQNLIISPPSTLNDTGIQDTRPQGMSPYNSPQLQTSPEHTSPDKTPPEEDLRYREGTLIHSDSVGMTPSSLSSESASASSIGQGNVEPRTPLFHEQEISVVIKPEPDLSPMPDQLYLMDFPKINPISEFEARISQLNGLAPPYVPYTQPQHAAPGLFPLTQGTIAPSPYSRAAIRRRRLELRASKVQASSAPHTCKTCFAQFNQRHKLNHHMRYHEKPHCCKHCQMGFGTKTHLERHINDVHLQTRKIHCPQHDCSYSRQGGQSFRRKDNWRRHMLKIHQQSAPEPVIIEDILMADAP